jgi:hypothetical protein
LEKAAAEAEPKLGEAVEKHRGGLDLFASLSPHAIRNWRLLGFVIILAILILLLAFLLARQGGSTSEEAQATSAPPSTSQQCPPGQEPAGDGSALLDADPSAPFCVAIETAASTPVVTQVPDAPPEPPGTVDPCQSLVMNGVVTGTVPTYGTGGTVVDRATITIGSDCAASIEAHWQLAYADFCVFFLGIGDGTFAPHPDTADTGDVTTRVAVYTTAVPGACPGVDLPGELESQLGGGLIEDGAFAQGRYGSYLSSGMPVDIVVPVFDGVAEILGVSVEGTSIPMTLDLKVSD